MYSLYLTKYHSSFKWISPNYLNISIQIYLKTLVTFPSIITTTFLTPYLYISSILTFILLHLTSFLLSIDFHFFYSSSFVSTFLQNNFFSSSRFYPCPFPPSCYNSNLFLAVYTSLPLLINNPFSFFHCLFPTFSLYWPRVNLFFLYFFSLISLFRFSRFFRFLPLAFICFISLSHTLLSFAFSPLPFALFLHLFVCFFLSSIHFLSPFIVCFLLSSPFPLIPLFLLLSPSLLSFVFTSLTPSIYFLPPSFPLFFLPFALSLPLSNYFSLSPFRFFLPPTPFHLLSLTFHLLSCFLFYYPRYFHFFVSLFLFTWNICILFIYLHFTHKLEFRGKGSFHTTQAVFTLDNILELFCVIKKYFFFFFTFTILNCTRDIFFKFQFIHCLG